MENSQSNQTPRVSIVIPAYNTASKPHGTGLGLAISRNIARVQGGDLIVARNEPGQFNLIPQAPDHDHAIAGTAAVKRLLAPA